MIVLLFQPMSSISWSRDGRRILTAASDMNVAIHDVLTGECEHKSVQFFLFGKCFIIFKKTIT